MPAKANLTKSANITVAAREIDFVTRFGQSWKALYELMGIMRPVKKVPGSVLKSKEATVVLQEGAVAEGEEIPYSLATVNEKTYKEMKLKKYKKGVTAEAILEHGYDNAVAKTDAAFEKQLVTTVLKDFYKFLGTGTLTNEQASFQKALAMAKGLVINQWGKLNLDYTEIVAFVNVLDYHTYLGDSAVTVQNLQGIEYVKDFMGYKTVFLVDDTKVPQGKVIATPVENLVLYYVDPADSDFAKAGFDFRTDGELALIGFHTEGNYTTLTSESTAIMGMELFAEYLNGIAVVTVSGAAAASVETKGSKA